VAVAFAVYQSIAAVLALTTCWAAKQRTSPETFWPAPDPDPGNDSYSYSHYQSMVGDSDVATATATFSCWRHKNISALQQSGADARRDTETIDFGTCIRCEHPALVLRCHVDPYRARSH